MESRPRWSAASLADGMYESYYLRAAHPVDPVAIWIRYTVQKAPGLEARASIWFTLFDPSAGRPFTEKANVERADLGAPDDGWIRIGDSTFGEHRIEGSGGDTSWSIKVEEPVRQLEHLARPWMYRSPIPRTKPESPVPFARLSGEVKAGSRTYELGQWPGMVGHNWGAEHAWTWVWLSGAGFAEDDEAWLDVVMGRIKVAGRLLPWVANGAISLRGERHRLGGMFRRGVVADPVSGKANLLLPGEGGVSASIETTAPKEATVAWNYGGPDGHVHDVLNCSMAELAVRFTDPEGREHQLTSKHGGTYELGLPDRQDWLEVEPYPDLW